ncbi:hypothetical protein FHS86_003915, partial [Roseimarinus sediminis]
MTVLLSEWCYLMCEWQGGSKWGVECFRESMIL